MHHEAGGVVRHHISVASRTVAGIGCDVRTTALRPTTTAASTTAIVMIAAADKCSPSNGQPQTIDSAGWASCTWLALAMPARAMPAYQAKKPRNIENSAVYPNAAHCVPVACRPVREAATIVTVHVSGAPSTSAQQIDLPATQLAGEKRAFGISDCGCKNRKDQQCVGSVQRAAAFVDDVRNDGRKSNSTACPIRGRRSLAGAQHRKAGGGQRKQPVDDRAVQAGGVLQGVGDEQRKAEDHAADDEDQSSDLSATWSRWLDDQQCDRGEDARDCGPADRGDGRIEPSDCDLGERQAEAEHEHANCRQHKSHPGDGTDRALSGAGGYLGAAGAGSTGFR